MKKLIVLSFAMFSFIFMANAQTGECRIDNVPGAYIHATSSIGLCKCGPTNTTSGSKIKVKITAYGVSENAEGAVTCVVTYVDKDGNEHKTEPFSITYKNRRGEASAECVCDPRGIRVKDIEIENSWCSAR